MTLIMAAIQGHDPSPELDVIWRVHVIWGWVSVLFGAAVALSIYFRVRTRRKVAFALLIPSILLFLFSLLQWVDYWE